MIEAELPDGRVLEFPDDTDPVVIQKTVKNMLGADKAQGAEKTPIGRPRDILGQAVFGMGKGLIGQAAGGARAIAGNLPAGQRVRQQVQDFGTPSRIGNIGERLLGRAAETIDDYAEEVPAYIAKKGEQFIGDPARAEETAQSVRDRGALTTLGNRLLDAGVIGPEGYAAINMAPEIAAGLAGGAVGIGKHIGKKRDVTNQLINRQQGKGTELVPSNQEVSGDMGAWKGVPARPNQPNTALTDAELAKYRLVEGKAAKDERLVPLVRKGFDPSELTGYKASTGTTKKAMQEMTDIKRKGLMFRDYAKDNRPADVVGRELAPQINLIRAKNKSSGQQIKIEAEKLKNQQVDFQQPFDDFLGDLEEMGINLRNTLNDPAKRAGLVSGSKGDVLKNIRALYNDSDLDLMPGFQKPLTNVIYRSLTGEGSDAFDLHKMKKYIDTNVTYGKHESGLAARVDQSLKNLRHDIDSVLDSNFADYKKVNDDYSETIGALDQLQDVLPRRIQIGMRGFEKGLGQELRKLESNYNVRVPLANAVEEIGRVNSKHGRSYDGDLSTLVTYMTDLDRNFGGAPATSLPGIIESTVRGVKEGTGPKEAFVKRFTQKLAPEDEQAFDYLHDILSSK